MNLKVVKEVEKVKQWVKTQIKEIQKCKSETHRRILILCLIDAFAQHCAEYCKKNNAEIFSDFLLKYNIKHNEILSSVCPATLYYDCFDKQNLELKLMKSKIYSADEKRLICEATRLLNLLPEADKIKYRERHKYVRLLYAMRNKLLHELVQIGAPIDFFTDAENPLPHIVSQLSFDEHNEFVSIWTLYIPEGFIIEVAQDAISNYLQECLNKDVMPFKNNSSNRKCLNAWYD